MCRKTRVQHDIDMFDGIDNEARDRKPNITDSKQAEREIVSCRLLLNNV